MSKHKMNGVGIIHSERLEQQYKHGFTEECDRIYTKGELKDAAIYCLTQDFTHYPVNWDIKYADKFNMKNYKERLAVAGALIAAELDRINKIEDEV